MHSWPPAGAAPRPAIGAGVLLLWFHFTLLVMGPGLCELPRGEDVFWNKVFLSIEKPDGSLKQKSRTRVFSLYYSPPELMLVFSPSTFLISDGMWILSQPTTDQEEVFSPILGVDI